METLPPEILHAIFTLVCTDGGRTGCTLSTVSRYIRAAALPIMLRTVVARGVRQMQALATLLEKRVPGNRMVRYLFLTDVRRSLQPALPPGLSLLNATGGYDSTMAMGRGIDEHEREKSEAFEFKRTAAIQLILALTAPTLTSLSLVIKQCQYTAVLLPVSLPGLTELTTIMHIRDPTLAVLSLESLPHLPRLRRWNINMHNLGVASAYLARRISRIAPRLTHLRFCSVPNPSQAPHQLRDWALEAALGVLWTPQDLMDLAIVQAAMGLGAVGDGSATGGLDLTVKLPTGLRDVYIRPMRGRDAYAGYMRLVYQESVHRVHIEYVPEGNAYLEEDWSWEAREAERECLERSVGRRGCWVHPRLTYSKNIKGVAGRRSLEGAA
ncbi:hypothetical protein FIBSPDRAFT_931736 [Athelia psychrophila]|uniref:Uncharacterized protein n=1 Tax=Athelia psychrophila TaxID=1759441 RepID=A0A166JXL5_9AGAM|nr:hypothetical protein FIBSPDRAFT_931736 [Fibularhizoctonia sp. CBS 109695]